MNYMQSNIQTSKLTQGSIIWASYPLTDRADKFKRRTVLVISNNESNQLDGDYIIIPITKTIRDEPFSLVIQPEDVLQGELPVASQLRCNKPFTVRDVLMYDLIGLLHQEKVSRAIQLLADSVRVGNFE